MCHFCNAQLFEITHAENIKSPLEQPSCQDAKVVEAFCDAGWRLSTPCRLLVRQPPVAALRVPAEMPTALHSHIASGWRHAFHRAHAILIASAALSVTHTPRLRALVHFGRRPIRRGDGSSLPASEMLHMSCRRFPFRRQKMDVRFHGELPSGTCRSPVSLKRQRWVLSAGWHFGNSSNWFAGAKCPRVRARQAF
jgi:hypothetical protein